MFHYLYMENQKENILKRLYNWTISWADKPYGLWALAILSFAESSFFPIPPDVLLIPLVFGAPKKWIRIASICTIASILGGVFGWGIGKLAWDATQSFFFPAVLAIGAKASFVARTIDMELDLTKEILVEGACHKGMAVTEALVNCVIFNHKTHADYADTKAIREERTIRLRHGEKMLFGAERNKGLVLDGLKLKVVTIGEDGYTIDDILTHDAHSEDSTLHTMLASMRYPEYPVAVGIIRDVERPTYDSGVARQVSEQQQLEPNKTADNLFFGGETWEVK